MSSIAKITICNPVEIEGDWEYCWFDSSHNHFLLLNDSYFYTLPLDGSTIVPALFAHIQHLPQNLLCARMSIDKRFVAIQTSLSSLLVVDVSNKKKWVVEIRHPGDNAILSGGIAWSDHGGNSEDLIIVTNKGMELYKISQIRNQCKLSRAISQPISSFWYNPEHRMIMLAAHAQPKFGYNRNPQSIFFTPDERPKEMLLVDAFFLNCEKSSIPMLELPPPDRVPRLELGPGLSTEDVSLVSLYGKILCLVRYVEHGLDFITVYHMTKQRAERIHCLSLNCPTSGLLYSTYDNLLICHCISERVSVVFDILSAPARSSEGVSASDKTHPLGTTSSMHYLHRHRGATAASVNTAGAGRSSSVDHRERTASHDARRSGLQGRNHSSSGSGYVFPEEVAARSQSRDPPSSEWGPLVTPQKRTSRGGAGVMMLPRKEADINCFETLVFTGELSAISAASAPSSPYPDRSDSAAGTEPIILSVPERAEDVYSTYAFEYLAPNRLLDSHRRVIWEIKCAFPAIVKELTLMCADVKSVPLFLARRGQRFCRLKQSAEGVLDHRQTTVEGRWAKQLLLSEMFQLLTCQAEAAALRAYYRSLLRSYGSEYRRLILTQYDAMHASETGTTSSSTVSSSTTAATTGGSTSIFSVTAAARRRIVAENFFGSARRLTSPGAVSASTASYGNNMGVYPGILTAAGGLLSPAQDSADGETPSLLDSDMLELPGTMQLMLPDISMVGVRARKQQYLRGPACSTQQETAPDGSPLNPSSSSSSVQKIKPTSQAIVLHTRRDNTGNLICTQSEILSHVWLPLLLNSDINYEYLALALNIFVTTLREANLSVAPAFSALLLNVLFHSHRHVEVSSMLQQRALSDSLGLALYSLEFCDILQHHMDNLSAPSTRPYGVTPASDSSPQRDGHRQLPSSKELNTPYINPNGDDGLNLMDGLQRKQSALRNMRQAALDMLWRLDERMTIAKYHLSHGQVSEAIEVCRKRNGQWRTPLTPGSIPASDFFIAAVQAVASLQRKVDEDTLALAALAELDGQGPGAMLAKAAQRLLESRAAAVAASVSIFHSLYLFTKDWDGVVLLSALVSSHTLHCSCIPITHSLYLYYYFISRATADHACPRRSPSPTTCSRSPLSADSERCSDTTKLVLCNTITFYCWAAG